MSLLRFVMTWKMCSAGGGEKVHVSKHQSKFALHRPMGWGVKEELIPIQTYLVPNTVRRCHICCLMFSSCAPLGQSGHCSCLTHRGLCDSPLQVLLLKATQLVRGRWDPESKPGLLGSKVQALFFPVPIFSANEIK